VCAVGDGEIVVELVLVVEVVPIAAIAIADLCEVRKCDRRQAGFQLSWRLPSLSTRRPVKPSESRLKLVLDRGFSVLSTERMYPMRASFRIDGVKM